MRIHESFRSLARTAREQGWKITQTKRGHLKWTAPGGGAVITASTPSSARSVWHSRAELRRSGLKDG